MGGPEPDLTIVAGAVETYHTGRRVQLPRGLEIRAGRILRSFDPDRGARASSRADEVLELPDAVVVPGFFDAHNHQPTAARDVAEIRTAHCRSLSMLQQAVREAARTRPEGSWLVTEHSLTISQLGLGRLPDASELDAATVRQPVAVRFGAHTMVLNTMALYESGISSTRADPPNGHVDRDTAGRPLGPIREYGATSRVLRLAGTQPHGQVVEAMRSVQRAYAEQGITSVRVPGLRPHDLEVYRSLLQQDGRLKCRVFAGPRLDPTKTFEELVETVRGWPVGPQVPGTWFGSDAVKIFVDSGVESVIEGRDALFLDQGELNALVWVATEEGWSVACHAVSRRAVDMVLDAYAGIRRTRPKREVETGPRLSIEHAFLAARRQLARAAGLGVWLSTQPGIGWSESDFVRSHSGLEDSPLDPTAMAVEMGVKCALGSDWNATPGTDRRPFSPLRTVEILERGHGEGGVVDWATAMHLHTRAGAQLVGAEDLGGIWPGARADLVAIRDAAGAAGDQEIVATLVGGHRVF